MERNEFEDAAREQNARVRACDYHGCSRPAVGFEGGGASAEVGFCDLHRPCACGALMLVNGATAHERCGWDDFEIHSAGECSDSARTVRLRLFAHPDGREGAGFAPPVGPGWQQVAAAEAGLVAALREVTR